MGAETGGPSGSFGEALAAARQEGADSGWAALIGDAKADRIELIPEDE